MAHLFYAEAKSWQGAIGSLLGFIALMIGALWNFHLNRRRDAELRAEEALTIAAALYGEIVLLRQEVAKLAASVAQTYIEVGTVRNPIIKFDRYFLAEHTLSEPFLYKSLASKVGLLHPDLVLPIIKFYTNLQEAGKWLPLQMKAEDRGYSYSILTVLIPARDAIFAIEPTLLLIERMVGIREPAGRPALGLAETVIDTQEEFESVPSEDWA